MLGGGEVLSLYLGAIWDRNQKNSRRLQWCLDQEPFAEGGDNVSRGVDPRFGAGLPCLLPKI